MSKNTNTVKKPLSNGAKKAIWITAICLVAVIALTVSLGYILNNDTINPDNDGSNSSGSSTLKIPNGDFLYTKSESTNIPYEAQNWLKKTYKDGSTFGDIEDDAKVVMGVVNTNDWDNVSAALSEQGLNVANPKTHDAKGVIDQEAIEDGEIDIANVYMIATKEATSASILSDSFSIPSSASVKISVWFNASLTSGSPSVMIQKSSTSTASKTSGNTQYWYAYDLEITEYTSNGANGWQEKVFYVFNRSSSSQSVRINVGLGDVYSKDHREDKDAEGVLFIDSIEYEQVTANEYRTQYPTDADVHTSYVIEPTDSKDTTVVSENWGKTEIGADVDAYLTTNAAKVNGTEYSPFVKTVDTFKIYNVDQDGDFTQNISLADTTNPDRDNYLHIYFWMRVVKGTTKPQASIVDITVDDASDKNLTKLTNIGDVKDITKDDNCGWKQYHIYVKPDQDATDATISVNINWADTGVTNHGGEIYVSDLMYEVVADSAYNNATANSTTTVKADLNKTHANTGVTNGTFGYLEDTDKTQPESWTPVYAGSNDIYNDGKGDNGTAPKKSDIANSIFKAPATTSSYDDSYGYYLAVTNNVETAQGYLSQSISLSAKSVYRISVLAKTEGTAKPFIYLVNQAAAQGEDGSREKAILAKFESTSTNSGMDALLSQPAQENGWVRYYFIVETADEAVSVNVALFNGSIDGTTKQQGTVYYDQVCTEQLGSYTVAADADNEDAKLYKVTYAEKSDSGYADLFDKYFLDVDGNTETMGTIEFRANPDDTSTPVFDNVKVIRLADDDKWAEMREIPEETEEDEVADDEDTTTETENDVDVALLLSVISSILLVACLLVVIVIKAFKKKRA